jgi:glycosyltransferase involved in cell wall biosynthesis
VKYDLAITGSRGIPVLHGGFETFAQELALELASRGFHVAVTCDEAQSAQLQGQASWNGIDLLHIPYSRLRSPLHYHLESFRRLGGVSSTILCCGVIGGPLSYVAKRLGSRILVNPGGLEWRRPKWTPAKKAALLGLLFTSCVNADTIVCDARAIKAHIDRIPLARKKTTVAEYGTRPNTFLSRSTSGAFYKDYADITRVLAKYNLAPLNYHLLVTRIVPENSLLCIARAYCQSKTSVPLVIVGAFDDTPFSRHLKTVLSQDVRVKLLGALYDQTALQAVRAGALAYIHGHQVGGTNPSLLEAMASGSTIICHDNEFNREVSEEAAFYFASEADLRRIFDRSTEFFSNPVAVMRQRASLARAMTYYTWPNIASKYVALIAPANNRSH